jgi:exodeoxyribonuclease-3
MKLISWNVNGIRATYKKGFPELVNQMNPDVICLQETKAQDDQVKEVLVDMGFHLYSNSAVKKGYSGTAILSKSEPKSVVKDMGIAEHDNEGRVIAADFGEFWLVNVYTPNSGQELARLGYRKTWDADFLNYLKKLEAAKPVIVCGDLNAAHQPIDLKNDKSNYNKTAGYTQIEIDGIANILKSGFVDTYRHFNPDTEKYSWWSWRGDARANNIGWRIDYFLVSQPLINRVKDTFILNEIEGSDHCPVGIVLG